MLRPCAAVLVALAVALTAGCSATPDAIGPQGVVASIATPSTSAPNGSGPTTSTSTTAGTPSAGGTGWYLALGDSLAAGRQPTTGDQPTRGYAGPVLAGLQQSAPGTQLKNLGCSGETTGSLLRGGLCRYPEGTQLEAATAFLAAHPGAVRLVTLDIGANNVLGCAGAAVDTTCAVSATTAAATDLASILARLRGAAPRPASSSSPTTTRCWRLTVRAPRAGSTPPLRSRSLRPSTASSRARPSRSGRRSPTSRARSRRRPRPGRRNRPMSRGCARGRGCAPARTSTPTTRDMP